MRPRALTSTQSPSKERMFQSTHLKNKHTRATSDLPALMTRMSDLHESGVQMPGLQVSPKPGGQQTRQYASSHPPNAMTAIKDSRTTASAFHHHENFTAFEALGEAAEVSRPVEDSQTPISGPTPVGIANSFLNVDEDLADTLAVGEVEPYVQGEGLGRELGFTFDDLVERLLSQPMSKSDGKFATIFLCLYRKFAAPSELLSAVLQRFQNLNEATHLQMSRVASQLRFLSVLAKWVSDYPGDFAHAQTRRVVSNFVANLAGSRAFAMAAKEIGSQLEIVSEDDDTEWACSDKNRSRTNTVESFLSISSLQSTASTLDGDSSTEDVAGGSRIQEGSREHTSQHSATGSLVSSTDHSENPSTGSFHTLLNSVENAQRQAQLLTPIPRCPLTKVQWHQLMDIPDEDVARELTRIDWIMFSSIRPRDLIRHVSLSGHEKDRCKSLGNVNRMIDQFNHVAFWVANLIVLRDKPKHRARMLEKFMGIAWVSWTQEADL